LLLIVLGRVSIDDDVINRTRIARVCVINMNPTAGFDRGLDDFALPVDDVTAPVKDVGAGHIGTILANDEGPQRLVISRRAFLSCHFDDGSGHCYFFGGACALLFLFRLWLRERQRRQQRAAEENGNWFLHVYTSC